MDKRIITAAITGSIHTPTMSPHLPITPRQIIDEILAVHEAGGTVCHVHVRDPKTGQPVTDLDIFREIASTVKSKCDIILCLTTGGGLGMSAEERVQTVTTFSPELASFNAGSVNFALFHAMDRWKDWKYEWEPKYLALTEDFIFPNTFKTLREFSESFNKNNTKPELEVYDSGMINNMAHLIERGYLKKPVYIQFVMGVLGGITPSPENLMFLVDYTKKLIGDFEFSVCVAGRAQFPICTQSLLLGGHVRVGLEDNLYLEKGMMAKSNAEQVAKIIRIARELGLDPATPDEGREILGLKGLDKVAY
ncbi:MAG: 3-keto-5-aminohexanoate cleavage protein [Desulfobacterales bacterium]|nr:3-keto-5-aminohexanoate cleavage protein [Desulfobacterales bacterium]